MATLIAIEGIDGAGKGTQAGRLVSSLREMGLRVDTLQFPRYSATNFGGAIGDFLNGRFGSLNQVHPQLAAVLYAGDRFESRPLLMQLMGRSSVLPGVSRQVQLPSPSEKSPNVTETSQLPT